MPAPGRLALSIVTLAALAAGAAQAQTLPTRPATQPAETASLRKTRAYRAARARAIGKLTARIKALPLAGGARVADFLAESRPLEAAFQGLLVSLPDAQPARYLNDGACEVTLAIAVREAAAALGRIRDRYYQGERFKSVDFSTVVVEGDQVVLRQAVLRQVAVAKAPPALTAGALLSRRPGLECFDQADNAAKQYWLEHVSDPGRREAESAAREDAMRRLAERIKRLTVDEEASLADFVAGNGKTDLREFVRGARLAGMRYYRDAPLVEAEMELPLRTVYAALKAWVHVRRPSRADQIRRLEQRIVDAQGSIHQLGVGCAEPGQLKKLDPASLAAIALASTAPAWLGESLRKTGRAKIASDRTADARQSAIRAAEEQARMSLAVAVMELNFTETISLDQLTRRDNVLRTDVVAWLHSAGGADEPKISRDRVELTLRLPLQPLWRLILRRVNSRSR